MQSEDVCQNHQATMDRILGVTVTIAIVVSFCEASVSSTCLRCICNVESGCRPIGCHYDVYSVSCGYFQIKEGYWNDCGRPGSSFKACANDYTCASNCVRAYMKRYIGGSGCAANCESYARIHNGGPQGCRYSSTLNYWKKVQQQACPWTVNLTMYLIVRIWRKLKNGHIFVVFKEINIFSALIKRPRK